MAEERAAASNKVTTPSYLADMLAQELAGSAAPVGGIEEVNERMGTIDAEVYVDDVPVHHVFDGTEQYDAEVFEDEPVYRSLGNIIVDHGVVEPWMLAPPLVCRQTEMMAF